MIENRVYTYNATHDRLHFCICHHNFQFPLKYHFCSDSKNFPANDKFHSLSWNRFRIWTAGSLLLLWNVANLWSYFMVPTQLKTPNESVEVLYIWEYKHWTALSPQHPFQRCASHKSWPAKSILLSFSSAVEMKYIVKEISPDLTKCCLSQLLLASISSKENTQQSFNSEAASQVRGTSMCSMENHNENSGFSNIILIVKYLFYPPQLHLSHGLSIMIIYGYHFGCSEQQCLGLVAFSAQDEKWSLKECSLPSRHVLTALILHLPKCMCWLLSHLETSGTESNWSN